MSDKGEKEWAEAIAHEQALQPGKIENAIMDLFERDPEAAEKIALRVLRADYWRDVRGLASDVAERVNAGDDFSDVVWELCDSSQRVIYTAQNLTTLLCCDNHDAMTEDQGGDDINWAALAFYALQRDVTETAQAMIDEQTDDDGDDDTTEDHA